MSKYLVGVPDKWRFVVELKRLNSEMRRINPIDVSNKFNIAFTFTEKNYNYSGWTLTAVGDPMRRPFEFKPTEK